MIRIMHSAKGSSWGDHKYLRKEGDKYVYADSAESSGSSSKTSSTSSTDSKSKSKTKDEFDLDAAATKIIRGEFGNGSDRKNRLGSTYKEVQKRVNEMMKKNLPKNTKKAENYVKSKAKTKT